MGVDTHQQVGAGYLSLKTLAARYSPDENLAEALWMVRKREEQIMACFLFPKQTNKEKITQLMQYCINTEIAEYMGSLWASEHEELEELLKIWPESAIPFLQIAALCAGARHLVVHKNDALISTDLFQKVAHKAYEDKYVRLVADRYRL